MNIRYATQLPLFDDGRLIVWFSCGAASACALKLVAPLMPLAVYCDTSPNENPDNRRFLKDVERWTGIEIQTLRSERYKTVEEVFEARRYMSGPDGAPCTTELKKVPRFRFQRVADIHCFGYTVEEAKRIRDFEHENFELNLAWPLRDAGMTKEDCFAVIRGAGIELPIMYKLGFRNNNCIGCVKASSPKYWNMIRNHFPEVFARRATQSRDIGCRLVKVKGDHRIFLDELAENVNDDFKEDLSCGPQCKGVSV